jgi:hypothetical protein
LVPWALHQYKETILFVVALIAPRKCILDVMAHLQMCNLTTVGVLAHWNAHKLVSALSNKLVLLLNIFANYMLQVIKEEHNNLNY